jgi:hypothetical protein
MVAYHTIGETNGNSSREGSEAGMDRRYARTLYIWTISNYLNTQAALRSILERWRLHRASLVAQQ